MTLLRESQKLKRNPSTFLTTLGHPRANLLMTPQTGLVLKVTSVHLRLPMPRSRELSMLKATGELFSSTSLKAMVTATTTTPKPPGWRPAYSPHRPVVFWHLATSPPAPSSMSTTGCCLWTCVIFTGDFLWTLSSYQVHVHAIFLRDFCTFYTGKVFLYVVLILYNFDSLIDAPKA